MSLNRREFLGLAGKVGAGIALAGLSLNSPLAYADTVYYGSVKSAKSPAYIVYNDVASKSKYQPGKDDNDRAKKIALRDGNIRTSVAAVAAAGKYDVVVEKGDPVIGGYKDISNEVIATLSVIEKNQ